MQTGISIQELAREIDRIENAKKDFVAPTTKLWAEVDPDKGDRRVGSGGASAAPIRISVDGNGSYDIGPVAHEQIGDRLGIPRKYYNRMLLDAPDLLTTNINCWMRRQPEQRTLRTLTMERPRLRAFLSDRFYPLDNGMVAQAALPILMEQGRADNLQIVSSQITERRMYLQAVFPKFEAEVKVGDPVQAGLILSNSEVGCGAFRVELLIFRLVCSNGMIRGDSMKRYHVGKRVDSGDDVVTDFYRRETIEADHKAYMMKIQDTVRHAIDETAFQNEVLRLQESTENKIPPKNIDDTVKDVTKRFNLTQDEGESVLGHLIEGGDLSQWGLANAVTRLAHDAPDYDRSVEIERIGGKVIDLPASEWKSVVNA